MLCPHHCTSWFYDRIFSTIGHVELEDTPLMTVYFLTNVIYKVHQAYKLHQAKQNSQREVYQSGFINCIHSI